MCRKPNCAIDLILVIALLFVSRTAFAQTGPGGTWNYGIYSYTGTLQIQVIGTDFNQPAGGNSAYVTFDHQFSISGGATSNYVCSWGSVMLIPFYNLTGTTGTPTYGADVTPAAKAMYNELLLYVASGKAIARVDFFLLDQSTVSDGTVGADGTAAKPWHRPCVLKLVQAAP